MLFSIAIAIAFALLFPPLAFGQTDISTKPRIYPNQGFLSHNVELRLEGTCQKLNRE
jgi:hypothetical protein